MRLRVSGPVSSIFCLPTRPNFGSSVASSLSVAQACSTPRGPNFLLVLGVLLAGVVELLRLLLGIQVIEVAEPFVEAVHGRQELVAVAQVVLAELAGGVALRLQHFGQRRIGLLDAARRAGDADRGHAGADRHLAHDERGAAGGAAGLAVVIGEEHAFLGDAVDVGRPAHHAVRVRADVPHADVVAQDDEDVGSPSGRCRWVLLRLSRRDRSSRTCCRHGSDGGTGEQDPSPAHEGLVRLAARLTRRLDGLFRILAHLWLLGGWGRVLDRPGCPFQPHPALSPSAARAVDET